MASACASEIAARFGREDRDLHLDAGVHVIALELVEEFAEIIGVAEHAVIPHQRDARPQAAARALENIGGGALLGFGLLQARIIRNGFGDESVGRLLGRLRQVLIDQLDRLIGREAQRIAQLAFQFVGAIFLLGDALLDARGA